MFKKGAPVSQFGFVTSILYFATVYLCFVDPQSNLFNSVNIQPPPPFPLKLCIGGLVPLFSIEARNSPVSIISPLFQSL